MEEDLEKNPTGLKFKLSVNNDQCEEILTHAEALDHIARDEESNIDSEWKFRRIAAHAGPPQPNHPNCKGSTWNVMVEWENGEVTSDSLSMGKLIRMVNQAKLRSYRTAPKHMFGFEVPRE